MNNDNTQQNKGGDGANNNRRTNQNGVAGGIINPYAVLNVSNGASLEEIQKSYKLLSRSFHPDKQPERSRQQAQEYFVQLKGAYDILMDPVCKFALDHFGYDGVSFLRRHTKLYQKISLLLRQRDERGFMNLNGDVDGDVNRIEQRAKLVLSEAMQYDNYQMTSMKMKKPTISGSVKVKCNTTHSHLLQEGIEPITLDVDQTTLQLSISDPIPTGYQSKNNVGVTCSASSTLKTTTGEGATNGQISLQYEPVQGTEVVANFSSQINMSTVERKQKQYPKVMLSTSRFMSNRTYVNASLSASLKSMFNFITLQSPGSDQGIIGEGGNDEKQKEDEGRDDWAVTLTTHRSLFDDKIRCTWIAGIALPSTKMQYGMVSISTNNTKNEKEDDDNDNDNDENTYEEERNDADNPSHDRNKKTNQSQKKSNKDKYWSKPAKHTLKLNLSMNHTPLQIITEKSISENHNGKAFLGYGPYGFDIRLLSIRSLSKFCQLTLGVGHLASAGGLSTMFQIERGSLSFAVPVLVSTKMSPAYAMKTVYVTLFISLIDQVVGDIVRQDYLNITDANLSSSSPPSMEQPRTHEDVLVEREKKKRDQLQQIELMRKSAVAKMKREEMKEDDGLVIIKAKYEVSGGDSIDVTVALQFWVINSSLHLPSMSKSSMLGFYDVRHEVVTKLEGGFWQAWQKVLTERFFVRGTGLQSKEHEDMSPIPTLTVRYRYGGKVHEITVYDHEELSLPSPNAMTLGGPYIT